MSDFIITPPLTMTVEHERRPVLHLPDGRVMVRAAGFKPMAMQTTGTFPQLTTKQPKPKGKGGGKGKGKC